MGTTAAQQTEAQTVVVVEVLVERVELEQEEQA
jgi:hypothetical protein